MKYLALGLIALPVFASADPTCTSSGAKNTVVIEFTGTGATHLLMQGVQSSTRFFMHHCSGKEHHCYYAANAPAGKYHLQEEVLDRNDFAYPVANDKLWFEVAPIGVSYLGDWLVERGDRRVVTKIEVKYSLKTLDELVQLCSLAGQRNFLSKTNAPLAEITN